MVINQLDTSKSLIWIGFVSLLLKRIIFCA